MMRQGEGRPVRSFLSRHRLEVRYLAIAAALIGILVMLSRLDAFSGLDGVMDDALHDSKDIGLVAIFLIALVSNLALIIQVPYTIPLLGAALAGSDVSHMLVLGLASGCGAGLGEMIKYLTAERILARRPGLTYSPLYQWVTRTSTTRPKLAALMVFVATATPLPDDVIIIPFAMVKHGVRRIALPLFGGKIAHNVVVALVFYQFTSWAKASTSTQVRADLVFGVVVLFVLVILYQAEKANAAAKAAAAEAPIEALPIGVPPPDVSPTDAPPPEEQVEAPEPPVALGGDRRPSG